MTKRTVTNGGTRTVATKGTGDWAVATEPDEIFIAQKKKVLKFNNWVSSELLEDGTSDATTIGGEPIWTKPARLGPPSEPPFPGSDPANYSAKNGMEPPRGEAEAYTASSNLKAENEPVVRVKDKTLQNARNTKGEVMTEVVLMDLSGDGGDEGVGGAGARGAKGKAQTPGTGNRLAGQGGFPASGTEPVEQCTVLAIRAMCQHRRDQMRVSSPAALLQVVAERGWHRTKLEAAVNGPCRNNHPVWTVVTGTAAPGKESFVDTTLAPKRWPETSVTTLVRTLMQRPAVAYAITCKGCTQVEQILNVEVYDPGTTSFNVPPRVAGKVIWAELMLVNFLASAVVDASEVAEKPYHHTILDEFRGEGSLKVEVREHTDHRAYVAWVLSVHFNPLIDFSCRVDILGIIIGLLVGAATGGTSLAAAPAAKGVTGLLARYPRIAGFFARRGVKKVVDGATGRLQRGRDWLKNKKDTVLDYLGDVIPELWIELKLKLSVNASLETPGPDGGDVLPATFPSALTGVAELALGGQGTSLGSFAGTVFVPGIPKKLSVWVKGGVDVRADGYIDNVFDFGFESVELQLSDVGNVSASVAGAQVRNTDASIGVKITIKKIRLFPTLQIGGVGRGPVESSVKENV